MAFVYHHIMRGLALLWLVVVAACFKPSPQAGAPCNAQGECPKGLECIDNVCVDPGTAPAPDACPGARCEGDTLIDCTGTQVTCQLGCSVDSGPHCLALVPSNGVTPDLLNGADALLMIDKLAFDTSDGLIKRANVIIRHSGEGVVDGIGFKILDDMAIWSAAAITVPSANDWSFTPDHAVVLYSATTILVDGILDLGAAGSGGGPGGNNGGINATAVPCRGGAGTAFATGFGEGGGGGGGETAGGNGAPSNQATFGAGGSQCTQPSAFPLRGGNGGGAGGFAGTLRGGAGGGGGGAIALVAMLNITVNGTIAVPGAGGQTSATGDGGGGGGSGGAILLEAPSIIVADGALTANGGGGAAGRTSNGARGSLATGNMAAGGTFNGTFGGKGGANTMSPLNGQNFNDGATNTISVGGGGGGAVGRIVLKALQSDVSNSVVSPGASTTAADIQ